MATPTYTFTPSTIIESAKVNQNFDDVDYTDIGNNTSIQWQNADTTAGSTITQDGGDDVVFKGGKATTRWEFKDSTNATQMDINVNNSRVNVYQGYEKRVYDSANAKYTREYHDSTNAFFGGSSGDTVLFSGSGTVRGAASEVISAVDSTTAKKVNISHDNTNGIFEVTSGDLVLDPASGTARASAGSKFRVTDVGGTDNLDFSHDGTDATIETTAGDLKIIAAGGNVDIEDTTTIDQSRLYVTDLTSGAVAGQITIEYDGAGLVSSDGSLDVQAGATDSMTFTAADYTFSFSTDDVQMDDAQDTGGTASGYITLDVGGSTRYIRLQSTP